MASIADYREERTRAVALYAHPGPRATENGVLFTAVAAALNLISNSDMRVTALGYEEEPGILVRYPDSFLCMSWDDHLAAAAVDELCFRRISRALIAKGFRLPDGNLLGRFPVLVSMLTQELYWMAALSYLWNCLESRDETTGKQLLWLASRRFLAESESPFLRTCIRFWKWVMMLRYPNGLQDLFAIYYRDPFHPFHSAAPKNFD